MTQRPLGVRDVQVDRSAIRRDVSLESTQKVAALSAELCGRAIGNSTNH